MSRPSKPAAPARVLLPDVAEALEAEGLAPETAGDELAADAAVGLPVNPVVREAREQNRPAADHWAHLTIHGLLHLLGYDHEQPGDAVVMESLETEILAGLGQRQRLDAARVLRGGEDG